MRKLKAFLLSLGIILFGGGILLSTIIQDYWVIPTLFGVGMLVSGMVVSWIEEYRQKKKKN